MEIANLTFRIMLKEISIEERERFADLLTMIAVEILKGEHLDTTQIKIGPVTQLDRVPDYESGS